MINIILLVLAVINTVWAYQRTKYAKDSLTLQRLDFKKRWSRTKAPKTIDWDDFKVGGTD